MANFIAMEESFDWGGFGGGGVQRLKIPYHLNKRPDAKKTMKRVDVGATSLAPYPVGR